MKQRMVPISNVRRLVGAGNALMERSPGEPGMGLIYGLTGLGKSTATAFWANQVDGIYVRAVAMWAPSSMLGAIEREAGVASRGTNAARIDGIVECLARSNRPLLVDEADYVVETPRLVDTLRDLHDLSTVPVVLIGMEGLQRKVMGRQQLAGRIAQWVKFGPATLEDAQRLAAELCEVGVEADLLGELHAKAGGSVRLIVVGLARIEHLAKGKGLKRVGAAEWGHRKLFLGDAPDDARTAVVRPIRAEGGE